MPPTHSPALLELDLTAAGGGMRTLDWLGTVRAAAGAGVDHLVLTGIQPASHHAAQALWECATACGMRVAIVDAPPRPAGDQPRIRIAADGIPRLLIPDGIPISDLPPALDLASIASPPVLRALQAATVWRPDQPPRP